MKISYDSKNLIDELTADIAEFGTEEKLAVWIKKFPDYDQEFIVNYDFLDPQNPVDQLKECYSDERLAIMTAGKLLEILKEQDKIL